MATKKITKKIITPRSLDGVKKITKEEAGEVKAGRVAEEESSRVGRVKRGCFFCQKKISPLYTDLESLRRFLTDRAKIIPKERSGACSKHQRTVAKNIKYARHLALLPFVPKV
ncbi:30S ribosomal protein S18 [Candidatus Daviesbacteria bacterium]|nr:30S ribosomal protein S18 [Candidatus Daviesbacteria bacterium]